MDGFSLLELQNLVVGGVAGGTQTEEKLVVEVEELEELLPAYLLLKKEKM